MVSNIVSVSFIHEHLRLVICKGEVHMVLNRALEKSQVGSIRVRLTVAPNPVGKVIIKHCLKISLNSSVVDVFSSANYICNYQGSQ